MTLILACALLAAAQSAPPPVILPPAPHPPTEAEQVAALRDRGFSETAVTLIREEFAIESRVVTAGRPAFDASFKDLTAAARRMPFDGAAFERIFRARQAAAQALQTRLLDMRFAMFRRLPVPDQVRFAGNLLLTQLIF